MLYFHMMALVRKEGKETRLRLKGGLKSLELYAELEDGKWRRRKFRVASLFVY